MLILMPQMPPLISTQVSRSFPLISLHTLSHSNSIPKISSLAGSYVILEHSRNEICHR